MKDIILQIKSKHGSLCNKEKNNLSQAKEIGDLLRHSKSFYKDTTTLWKDWIQDEVEISISCVNRYILISEKWDIIQDCDSIRTALDNIKKSGTPIFGARAPKSRTKDKSAEAPVNPKPETVKTDPVKTEPPKKEKEVDLQTIKIPEEISIKLKCAITMIRKDLVRDLDEAFEQESDKLKDMFRDKLLERLNEIEKILF